MGAFDEFRGIYQGRHDYARNWKAKTGERYWVIFVPTFLKRSYTLAASCQFESWAATSQRRSLSPILPHGFAPSAGTAWLKGSSADMITWTE